MARIAYINEYLFPAHAGVILLCGLITKALPAVPRTRGGDPEPWAEQHYMTLCSPHTRG